MADFYVTFGQRYARTEHPVLGWVSPEEVLHLEAEDFHDAREKVVALIDIYWSDLYDATDWAAYSHLYPRGARELALLCVT